ncbi:MAG TPA: response regulator [Rhodoblastus sp.]|nr:response regulator [Rhodoblastus sp.]
MARILVVEDNELNRDMLSRRLVRAGYVVTCAVDGPEAIRAVEDARPDLVLMDIALGEMDGFEATQRIKANPDAAATPIIALTAHSLESHRRRSAEAGCCDFDTKPIDFPRLLSKIQNQLSTTHRSSAN